MPAPNVLNASTEREIDAAFAHLVQQRVNAFRVGSDSLFLSRRDQVVALATRHAIPAIYNAREFAASGGLASYAPSFVDVYRQAGIYTAKILKGAKPADLPVIQLTKFDLVLSSTAAKKLGVNVSRDFLARVDEVIE